MRPYLIILSCLILISCKDQVHKKEGSTHEHQVETKKTDKKKTLSPHTSAMAMVGDAHVHIDYSSPGVRNRIIFGGLLAYDEVWQAGAHMATWIETDKDLMIDGKKLAAGKYGFFTIPSQDKWTVIFNTRWNQHGKDEYNTAEDVLRLEVTPEISEEITEHLVYTVKEITRDQGVLTLAWEKVTIAVPFEVVR